MKKETHIYAFDMPNGMTYIAEIRDEKHLENVVINSTNELVQKQNECKEGYIGAIKIVYEKAREKIKKIPFNRKDKIAEYDIIFNKNILTYLD
ncbi:MAG: hypothetical protein PHQ66_03145 [Candidatus Nanoarchaeia archaeon]|nr:hypothetical protein [Candidatus Nanoarchaeia archaeon]MDD5357637.1 hypothetical protein [Candidatus Nanoarchaeia archaeon]MDD5588556.1 hypothetical protein [Candidatus Nanoarchaeia archaeon]